MKTICIYHSRDLDGWMSAAIVKKWFIEQNLNSKYFIYDLNNKKALKFNNNLWLDKEEWDFEKDKGLNPRLYFLGWDYGDEIPDLSNYNKVIMCDISFPEAEMEYLGKKLIWIDHHSSAIKNSKQFGYDMLKGLRDDKFAACELTWKHLIQGMGGNPDKECIINPMPEIVRLLGRYDCFGHKNTDEEQKVLEFQYGARQVISNYEEAYNYLSIELDSLVPNPENKDREENPIYKILNKGKAIYSYLKTEAQYIYKKAFDIEILNKRFKCTNIGGFNPSSFNLPFTKDGYDGYVTFVYSNSKKAWTITLRSETIDVSEIAKQYGGGGHKGAAGFVIENINEIII